MVDVCESCRKVSEIINRHCGNGDSENPLEKREIFTIINWIQHIGEFKSSCRCFIKDGEVFWNLMKLLRKFYDVAARLIETLNEACLAISHIKQIITDSTSDSNESMDEDGIESEGFTLKERSTILEMCAQLLVENFHLYAFYQRHFAHTAVLFPDKHVKYKKFLSGSNISTPIWFMLDAVWEKNILQRIATCLKKMTKPLLPAEIVLKMYFIVLTVKNYASEITLHRFVWPIREDMLSYLCDITDTQGDLLRDNHIRQLCDYLWTLSRDFSNESGMIDTPGLTLAVKHLNSPFLAPRLAGIHQINNLINFNQEINNDEFIENFANCLQSKEIVQTIFGPNLHVELVKQSHVVLNFLAARSKLTKRDLDCVWAASHIKHCGRQTLDLLSLVVKNLEPELFIYLYGLLKTLKPSEHNDLTLQLTCKVIKLIWSLLFLKSSTQHPRRGDEGLLTGGSPRARNVLIQKVPSTENVSVKELEEDGAGDYKKFRKNIRGDSLASELLPSAELSEIGSSSSSPPPPLTSVPDDPINASTSTPLKRNSSNEHPHIEGRTSPLNKRQKISGVPPEDLRKKLGLNSPGSENPHGVCADEGGRPSSEDDDEHSSSSWQSFEGQRDESVQRLMKFVKHRKIFPACVVLVEGRGDRLDVVQNEYQSMSNNNLLETLVKNKPQIRGDRSMEISDSEVSSDAATSSDRLGDFDDEDMMKHSCSPVVCEEDEDTAEMDLDFDESMPRNRSIVTVSRFHLLQQQQKKFASNMTSSSSHIVSWTVRSDVSDDELDAFNLNKVCESGNTLLWDLVQDDLYEERLSIDNENLTLCLLEELVVSNPFVLRQFLEACIDNLKCRRSALVSVKLLLKLFSLSRNINCGAQHVNTVVWCDEHYQLVDRIVDDLAYFRHSTTKSRYGEEMEIKSRLSFLDHVFSYQCTQKTFVLTRKQLDVLWDCLSLDDLGRERLYIWIIEQCKTVARHSIDSDLLNYIIQTKLNRFNADTLPQTGLQLLHIFLQEGGADAATLVLPLLWQVALRNIDTNVGMSAMQFVSDYYVHSEGSKSKEKEFIDWCMEHLRSACDTIETCLQSSLMIIHRALNLLYSHIDSFRRRYAFHLRLWELRGVGVNSHCKALQHSLPEYSQYVKVYVQIGNSTDKTSLTLNYSDSLSQLRAEIYYWYHFRRNQQSSVDKKRKNKNCNVDIQGLEQSPADSALPHPYAFRVVYCGRELSSDFDDRSLMELAIKDNSTLMACSTSPSKITGQNGGDNSLTKIEDFDLTPMSLLRFGYWRLLMTLTEKLYNCVKQDSDLSFRCRTYCMRAWEVIQLLPTNSVFNEKMTDLFQHQNLSKELFFQKWEDLFETSRRHTFLYSLQVLELIFVDNKAEFLSSYGVDFIVKVLISKAQYPAPGQVWDQWSVECVTSMLRIVYASVSPLTTTPTNVESRHISSKRHHSTPLRPPEIVFYKLELEPISNTSAAEMIYVLMDIIVEFTSERVDTVFCSSVIRLHGINCCFQLLSSLIYSSNEYETTFLQFPTLKDWLKLVLLDCGDISLRREVSNGIFRLCRGKRTDGVYVGRKFVRCVVVSLLANLEFAEKLTPPKREDNEERKEMLVEGKEPFGLSPLNYFFTLNGLIEYLRDDFTNDESKVYFDEMCVKVFEYIEKRVTFERRDSSEIDYGLQGLLQLFCCLIKINPQWKMSEYGLNAVRKLFDWIFLLPTKQNPDRPKCKSQDCRTASFDLLVEMAKKYEPGYLELHSLLMRQNSKESHDFYPWDYWPADERRSSCGFVGVMNLGATCYMASAVQQLFMLPKFRKIVLNTETKNIKEHDGAFYELQRMFTFLSLSERKAYNPRSFCKSYVMNHQPLNVTEQKDMNEFFTDLITKFDEMSPDFRKLVKKLFGGVMSNNVVSLNCPHVSKTTEVFYSVRCPVADMKNLYDSLNSMTVADMLEGDNMYTCSHCNKKVRAEKRACFKQLPRYLCFNTMRYTFNMLTMMKEKVNTHFSFPMHLNMSAYMEENLLPVHANDDDESLQPNFNGGYDYELIGVTVHTGTAEGGHYYSFIKDRKDKTSENWYCFNDAEVRTWDPSNMETECFGGELTKTQYDSVTEKYLDLSYEKTNSAYMLFYERLPLKKEQPVLEVTTHCLSPSFKQRYQLSADLENWIYDDNKRFIQDLMFFDHAYSNFVWQICSQVPATLLESNPCDLTLLTSKLSLCFVLETLIHSKEKPTLTNWTELVIKELSSSAKACEWFLEHAAKESEWLTEILIGSPSKINREMFQKLCLHAILQLQMKHEPLYLLPWEEGNSLESVDVTLIGQSSCVTRFMRQMLSLISSPNPNLDTRQLNEYFVLILEFGRLSKVALKFLIMNYVFSTIVAFYITKSTQEKVLELGSEDESDEDSGNNILSLVRNACGLRSLTWTPSVLDKIVKILLLLLDGMQDNVSMGLRSPDLVLLLSPKGFHFLMELIKDCNSSQLCGPLILSLCSLSPKLTPKIIDSIFERLQKSKDDVSDSYFHVLNFLIEHWDEECSSFDMMKIIIEKIWNLASTRPLPALKWFEHNVGKHKDIYASLKMHLEEWTDMFLFKAATYSIRQAAAEVLIACVQSSSVRQSFSQICSKSLILTPRQAISAEATKCLHEIYEFLLSRLPTATNVYADPEAHGTHRLVSYFNVLKACLVSRDEKLMVVQYFNDLWRMYKAHMCEKQLRIQANKQSLLTFWYMASIDCNEMVTAAMKNSEVLQHFMYTYIFTQNEDELIEYNKKMLHAFYGLMRLFCINSDKFAEIVMMHENLDFACKSVTTIESYSQAKDEIFGAIEVCFRKFQNHKEKMKKYREKVFDIYLHLASSTKTNFSLLLKFFRLVETEDDKLYLVEHQILPILSENFFALHTMHHTATGCTTVTELLEILKRLLEILKFVAGAKELKDESEQAALNAICRWTSISITCSKLMELLNSFNPADVRKVSMECVKKITSFSDGECLRQVLTMVGQVHATVRTSVVGGVSGPYFPRRSFAATALSQQHLRRVHPPHPMLHMCLNSMQIESAKGLDPAYDQALHEYFTPYHSFIDRLLRCACNCGSDVVPASLIAEVSCLLGIESVPLQLALFPKFWLDLSERLKEGKDVQDRIDALRNCEYFREYIDVVFTQEQCCLVQAHIYTFVHEILTSLAPEMVLPETKRLALENALSVLSDSAQNVSDDESERISFLLNRRIGALRVALLLCESPVVANQLKSLDFWRTLPIWLKKIIKPSVSRTLSLEVESENQQASSSVQMLQSVINELNAKVVKMSSTTTEEVLLQPQNEGPSSPKK